MPIATPAPSAAIAMPTITGSHHGRRPSTPAPVRLAANLTNPREGSFFTAGAASGCYRNDPAAQRLGEVNDGRDDQPATI